MGSERKQFAKHLDDFAGRKFQNYYDTYHTYFFFILTLSKGGITSVFDCAAMFDSWGKSICVRFFITRYISKSASVSRGKTINYLNYLLIN